jgi:hypothetical protein
MPASSKVYLNVWLFPSTGSPLLNVGCSAPACAIDSTVWGLSALDHSQVTSVSVEILIAAGSKAVSFLLAPTPTKGMSTTVFPF